MIPPPITATSYLFELAVIGAGDSSGSECMMATMITHRRVDVERDVDALLELHSHANYASSSPWVRSRHSFERFRDHWLTTSQPKEFLGNLANDRWKTATDGRAEVWEVDGEPAGFVWVRVRDIDGYDYTSADLDDLAVAPAFRRMGIGSQMVEFAEEEARASGANALYIDTGWENTLARLLYEKQGFYGRELRYEKLFRLPDSL